VWTIFFSNGLAPYLRWGTITFFVLFLISSLLYFHFLRRVRSARYYVLRERARRAGGRWLIVAVLSLALGIVSLYLHTRLPSGGGFPTAGRSPPPLAPSVAEASTPSVSTSPSPTPLPTSTPRPIASPSPMPTPTPTATPTPAYVLPPTALTPKPGATPASPEARITLVTLALDEQNGRPVEPGDTFPPGDHRVYLFIQYEGMSQGVIWTYGWYREGEYLDGNTCLWGVVEETCPRVFGEAGSTFLFFNPRSVESGEYPHGYVPGVYEVRVWIEDRFQGSLEFTITE